MRDCENWAIEFGRYRETEPEQVEVRPADELVLEPRLLHFLPGNGARIVRYFDLHAKCSHCEKCSRCLETKLLSIVVLGENKRLHEESLHVISEY